MTTKGNNTRIRTSDYITITHVMEPHYFPWAVSIWDVPANFISNSNLAKSRVPITFVMVVTPLWNLTQSTTVILPCSVQTFKMISQLRNSLQENAILRDFSPAVVSEGFPILQQPWDFRLRGMGHFPRRQSQIRYLKFCTIPNSKYSVHTNCFSNFQSQKNMGFRYHYVIHLILG